MEQCANGFVDEQCKSGGTGVFIWNLLKGDLYVYSTVHCTLLVSTHFGTSTALTPMREVLAIMCVSLTLNDNFAV